MENKLDENDLTYKICDKKKKKTYDFQEFATIKPFWREIWNNDLSLDDALEQQIRLKNDIDIFKKSTKRKESVKALKNVIILLNRRKKVPNVFQSEIFSIRKQEKEPTS